MQVLAGIITEGQYKKGLNESVLQENLWDKIKDAPKKWMSKIQGGAPAIMALALVDSGLPVGKYIYYTDINRATREKNLYRSKIKSVNYNTGDVDMTNEVTHDGGKNWVTDDVKGLAMVLGFEEELSKLSSKSEEELQTWYYKMIADTQKDFAKKNISYDIKDFLNNPGLSLA